MSSNNFYKLRITSTPKRRHVKWGAIEQIIYNNKKYTLEEFYKKHLNIHDNFDEIEKIIIHLDEEPGKKSRPYPNILTIDFRCYAIDSLVEKLLIDNKIEHKLKPLEISNGSEVKYKVVYFPELSLLDLDQSNAFIDRSGHIVTKGKTYFDSPKFFNENLKSVKGIVRIKGLGISLVCSEFVKEIFEKNKLVGPEFTRIGDIVELQNYYWKVSAHYVVAIKEGDYEEANRQYILLENIYEKFMAKEKGEIALKELMTHWHPSVQLCASTQLIFTYPQEATKVLEELSQKEDIIGATAKTTLQELKKGNLKKHWLHELLERFSGQFTFKKITQKNLTEKN